MIWWLWMIAGAAAAALAFIASVWVLIVLDERRGARLRVVRERKAGAEAQMQHLVQETIGEMFRSVRNYR